MFLTPFLFSFLTFVEYIILPADRSSEGISFLSVLAVMSAQVFAFTELFSSELGLEAMRL